MNARGTRDIDPATCRKRDYLKGLFKAVFVRYGFEPLETPAIENLSTLEGNYGEEGENLLFRILERGQGGREGKTDLGLRYDLTVPLARYMGQNPQTPMPFRRYQMQPVWRADRPQKGRYREFLQCDVDIVGTHSLYAEIELLSVWASVLSHIGIVDYTVSLNHRGLLSALMAKAGCAEQERSVLMSLDKLDKIGTEGVDKDLEKRGLSMESRALLMQALEKSADLEAFSDFLGAEARSLTEDLQKILKGSKNVVFDGSLARGLSYYTGPVFEVRIAGSGVGSVGGGGRYDGLMGLPAVGASLGFERLLTVLEDRGQLKFLGGTETKLLVSVFSEALVEESQNLAGFLRTKGIPTEMWLGSPSVGIGKQLKFAFQKGIRYVAILGPEELEQGTVTLKDLHTGKQERLQKENIFQEVS